MMKVGLLGTVILLLLTTVLVACTAVAGEPDAVEQLSTGQEVAADAPAERATPESAPTSSPTPEPTATPTPKPPPTQTATASPNPTDTPEPTSTPTDTPEPTATATTEPELVVEAGSINVRGGPGTNYEIISAASQGDRLAILGQISECQWLQVENASGIFGWVTGDATYVSLNQECDEITVAEAPQPPASTAVVDPGDSPKTETPPSLPAGGTGRITLVNTSDEYAASVFFKTCCDSLHLAADPGQTNSLELSADEYQWGLAPHGCLRYLPQLFLTDGMEITVKFIPIEEGCGFYAEVTIVQSGGDVQVTTYPLDGRG